MILVTHLSIISIASRPEIRASNDIPSIVFLATTILLNFADLFLADSFLSFLFLFSSYPPNLFSSCLDYLKFQLLPYSILKLFVVHYVELVQNAPFVESVF